jgi:hypothetical protein
MSPTLDIDQLFSKIEEILKLPSLVTILAPEVNAILPFFTINVIKLPSEVVAV